MNTSYSDSGQTTTGVCDVPRNTVRKQRSILESIGQRIAAVRKARDITQVELAKKLGVSQANVSSYERGVLRIPCDQLLNIAQVLQVSTDELLGIKSAATAAPMGRRLRRRLELLENLSKRDQDALTRFLDAWVTRVRGQRAA